MAYKVKSTPRPHINKDGSKSKTKMDHVVTVRHRKHKKVVAVCTSAKAADELVMAEKVAHFGPQK